MIQLSGEALGNIDAEFLREIAELNAAQLHLQNEFTNHEFLR
jgi:hypothetical protein